MTYTSKIATLTVSLPLLLIFLASVSFGIPADEPSQVGILARYKRILSANPKEGSAFDKVYQLYLEGDGLDKLLEDYRADVRANPGKANLRLILGHIYKRLGRDEDARKEYQQAVRLAPKDYYARFVLGTLMLTLREYERAIEQLEEAVKLKPTFDDLVAAYKALGKCYLHIGDKKRAISVWREIAKIDPKNIFALLELAEIFREQEFYEEAISQYRTIIRLKSDDAYRVCLSLREIGNIYELMGEKTRAIEEYEKAISRTAPDNWMRKELRNRIIDIYKGDGDLSGLISYYQEKLKADENDVEILGLLADAYVQAEQYDRATEIYRRTLKLTPSSVNLRLRLVEALKRQLDSQASSEAWNEAAREYERIIGAEPDDMQHYQDLGELYLLMGKRQKAKETWMRIIERRPDDASARLTLAELFRQHDFVTEAIGQYEQAIELAPQNNDYKEYLGEFYLKRGDKEKALATWNRMVSGEVSGLKSETRGANYSRLAEVLSARGFKEEAINAAKKATELAPEEYRYFDQLARFLSDSKQYDEALVALSQAEKLSPTDYFKEQTQRKMVDIYRKQGVLDEKIKMLEALLFRGSTPKQRGQQEQEDLTPGQRAKSFKLLSRMYSSRGNTTKTQEYLAKALELAPNDIAGLRWQAELFAIQAQSEQAIETYRRLIDVDKANAREYYSQIAQLYHRAGNAKEAQKAARQVILLGPQHPESYRLWANIATGAGDYDEAISSLRRAVRLEPDTIELRKELGNAFLRAGKPNQAAEQFWQCFNRAENTDAKLSFVQSLTNIYRSRDNLKGLKERLRKLKERSPNDINLPLALAEIDKRTGNQKGAMEELKRALRVFPQNPRLLSELTKLAKGLRRTEDALFYQRELTRLEPSIANRRELGELLFELGKTDKAIEIWKEIIAERAAHRSPLTTPPLTSFSRQSPTTNPILELVDALLKHGLKDEAIATLKDVPEPAENDWLNTYRMGAIYVNLDVYDQATTYFEGLLQMSEPPPPPPKSGGMTRQTPPSSGAPAKQWRFWDARNLAGEISRSWQSGYYQRRGYVPGTYLWMPSSFQQAQDAALAQLALMADKEKRLDEFVAKFDAQANKNDLNSLARLVSVYLMVGRNADAQETIDKMLSISPSDMNLHNEAYNLAIRQNDVERAQREFKYIATVDRKRKLYILDQFARLLRNAGKSAEADRLIEETLKEDTFDTKEIQTVCYLLINAGKLDEAKQLIDKAEAVDKRRLAYLYISLADAYVQRRDGLGTSMDLYFQYWTETQPDLSSSGGALRPPQGQTHRRLQYSRYRPAFPIPNIYIDYDRLEALRRMWMYYSGSEEREAFLERFKAQLERAEGNQAIPSILALCYFSWWENDMEKATSWLDRATAIAPNDRDVLWTKANLLLNSGNTEEGMKLLSKFVPSDRNAKKDFYFSLLYAAKNSGTSATAREAVNALLKLNLTAREYMRLADECQQLRYSDGVKAALNKALEQVKNSRDVETLLQLADRLLQNERRKEAIELAKRILNITRTNPRTLSGQDILMRVAQILRNTDEIGAEIQRLETALKEAPGSPQTLTTLAQFYQATGRVADAMGLLQRALELEPKNMRLRSKLAQQFYNQRQYAEAVKHYKVLLEANAGYVQQNWWNLMEAFLQAGEAKYLVKWTLENSQSTLLGPRWGQDYRRELARRCLERKLYAEATELYQSLLKDSSQNEYDYVLLSDAYAKNGKPEKAITTLRDVIFKGQGSALMPVYRGGYKYQAISKLVSLYSEQDKLDQFEQELDDMLKRGPESIELICAMALVRLRQGKHADAKNLSERLISLISVGASSQWALHEFFRQIAQEFMKARAWEATIELCKRLISIAPRNQNYYEIMGKAYYSSGQKAQAKTTWLKMLSIARFSRDRFWRQRRVADIFSEHKMYDEAEKIYKSLMKTAPDMYARRDVQRSYIMAAQKQNKLREAIAFLEKEGALDDAQTIKNIIWNYPDIPVEKIALWQKVLEIDPEDKEAYQGLTDAYRRMQEPEKAIALWQEFIKKHPQNPAPYRSLLNIYSEMRNYEAAIENGEKLVELKPTGENYRRLGNLYKTNRQVDKATAVYQRGLQSDPNNYSLLAELTRAYMEVGKEQEAEGLCRRMLRDFHEDYQQKQTLSILRELYYQKHRDLDEYVKELEAALKERENARMRTELAKIYAQKGQYEKAIEHYKKAAEQMPGDASLSYRLAETYIRAKRYDDAERLYDEMLKRSTEEHTRREIRQRIAALYKLQGRVDELIEAMESQLQGDAQKDAEKYIELAQYYKDNNQPQKAIKVYQQAVALEPKRYNAYLQIAQLHINAKQYAQAEKTYRQALKQFGDELRQDIYGLLVSLYLRANKGEDEVDKLAEELKAAGFENDAYLQKSLAGLYANAKQYDKAIAIYQKLNQASRGQAARELAGVYEQLGQYDKAIEVYRSLMKVDGWAKESAAELTRLYKIQNRMDELVEELETIPQNAVNPRVYREIADSYKNKQQYKKAIEAYQKAIEVTIKGYELNYLRWNLGECYLKIGESEKAEKLWAVNLLSEEDSESNWGDAPWDDGIPDTHSHRDNRQMWIVWRFQQAGKLDELIAALEKRAEELPQDYSVRELLGSAYAKLQRHDKAVSAYEEAIDINPSRARSYLKLGLYYADIGDLKAAGRVAERLRKVISETHQDYSHLAHLYWRAGQCDKAAEYYVRANMLAPKHYGTFFLWPAAASYFAAGEYEKTAELYERLWIQGGRNYRKLWRAGKRLRFIYGHENLFDQKIEKYEQKSKVEPDNARIRAFLAMIYLWKGEAQKAIKEYQQALEIARSGFLYNAIGKAYEAAGDYEAAVAVHQKALEFKNSSWVKKRLRKDFIEACKIAGETKCALEELHKYVESAKSWEKEDALKQLWYFYRDMGMYSEAIAEFEKFAESNVLPAVTYELLGDAYKHAGEKEKADAAYREWFDLRVAKVREEKMPFHKVQPIIAACIWYKHIMKADALDLAIEAAEANPENAWAQCMLATTYMRNGRNAEAFAPLAKAAQIIEGGRGRDQGRGVLDLMVDLSRKYKIEEEFLKQRKEFSASSRSFARAVAHVAMSEYYRHRGQIEKANSEFAKSGFIAEPYWQVIGPYESPENIGFYFAYPPEKLLGASDARGLKKNRANIDFGSVEDDKVYWQPMNDGAISGFIDFTKVYGKMNWMLVYAHTSVVSLNEREVQFRIGSDDDIKVWFNGELVLSRPTARSAEFDDDIVDVKLRKGVNQILVKVCNRGGEWGMMFRITDKNGKAMTDLKFGAGD